MFARARRSIVSYSKQASKEGRLSTYQSRTVGRSENPGVSINVVGIICPPLVQIGLPDLP